MCPRFTHAAICNAGRKAIEEAGKKQELMQKLFVVAEKNSSLSLRYNKRSAFICIIARSPADLICKGGLMHYCVGRCSTMSVLLKSNRSFSLSVQRKSWKSRSLRLNTTLHVQGVAMLCLL